MSLTYEFFLLRCNLPAVVKLFVLFQDLWRFYDRRLAFVDFKLVERQPFVLDRLRLDRRRLPEDVVVQVSMRLL